MNPSTLDSIIEHRRRTGAGRLDECWEGVWHLTDPTARHQDWAGRIYRIHSEIMEEKGGGKVWISINVTDREENWIHNHRCPDGALILESNPGRWIGEDQVAFMGGPDLVVEISDDEEETLRKLPFYRRIEVREVLLVDQTTGDSQLWRLESDGYRRVEGIAASAVTGLEYSRGPKGLEIRDPRAGRRWTV